MNIDRDAINATIADLLRVRSAIERQREKLLERIASLDQRINMFRGLETPAGCNLAVAGNGKKRRKKGEAPMCDRPGL